MPRAFSLKLSWVSVCGGVSVKINNSSIECCIKYSVIFMFVRKIDMNEFFKIKIFSMEPKCETGTSTTLTSSDLITCMDDNDNSIKLIACWSSHDPVKEPGRPIWMSNNVAEKCGLHRLSEITSYRTGTIIDSFWF